MNRLIGLLLGITMIALTPSVGNAYDLTDKEIEHLGLLFGGMQGGCKRELEKDFGKKKWEQVGNVLGPLAKKYEKHALFSKTFEEVNDFRKSNKSIAKDMCKDASHWIFGVILGLNLK